MVIREENDRAVLCHGEKKIDDADPEAMTVHFLDKLYRGSIKLMKYGADGSVPLEGVMYRLEGKETGEYYTAGTDENGTVVWENLIPQHYVITEISTAEGMSLLKDPIEVTLPLAMSGEEAKAEQADLENAVWDAASGTWCFFDLTYEIRDDITLEMPSAGAEGGADWWKPAGAAAVLASGMIFWIGHKRRKKDR